MPDESAPREMALPATALVTLRRRLRNEAGPLATVHALHAAGSDSGTTLADHFLRTLGDDPQALPLDEFWSRFRAFWSRRGWGTLDHRSPHPGVGLVSSPDWAEAGEAAEESQPSCAFTSGMLSSLLSRTAGGPIAVLELTCRARGDDECAFAYAAEETIHELYGALLEGADLESALAAL